MHALLLESQPADRALLREGLERRGWSVHVAETTDSARLDLRAGSFPLVVIGFDASPAAAAELCRTIRASRSGRAAFLLAVTGDISGEAVRALASAGADQYLLRPLDPPRVEAAIAFAEGHILVHGERAASYPQRIGELQEALRVQQAALEELFNSAPEGVAIVDEKDRIRQINGEFTRMFGYTVGDAVGRPINDLIIPPDLWEEGMRLTEGVRQGERIQVDTVRRRKDGTLVDVSVLATPIRVGGGPIGAYGIYRDITERMASERSLRESEARYRERTVELEAALQTRSRLYSSINHELRTPLSAIMLHQELLLSGALGALTPDQAESLERANTAASHLLDLVVDVLDLSKLEAGRVTVTPVSTSLGEMLRALHATARPLVHRYGSELHLDLGSGPDEIVTDPQRVRQVLLNLLSNAAKFGRGEPVLLRRRDGHDGEVRLEVLDRGIGIGEEDLPVIFDDFVQVGRIQEGGTGLGLAISRRLADLLGGRLEVESEIGVGSTFRLVLPHAHPEGLH